MTIKMKQIFIACEICSSQSKLHRTPSTTGDYTARRAFFCVPCSARVVISHEPHDVVRNLRSEKGGGCRYSASTLSGCIHSRKQSHTQPPVASSSSTRFVPDQRLVWWFGGMAQGGGVRALVGARLPRQDGVHGARGPPRAPPRPQRHPPWYSPPHRRSVANRSGEVTKTVSSTTKSISVEINASQIA